MQIRKADVRDAVVTVLDRPLPKNMHFNAESLGKMLEELLPSTSEGETVDQVLIEEVLWDLVVERVITPCAPQPTSFRVNSDVDLL